MSVGIKAQASIDGAKKFQDDLKNMTAKGKALDAEMKALTSSFDKEGKSQKQNAKEREALNKVIAAQQEKAKLLSDQIKKLEDAGEGETAQCYKLREQLAQTNQKINEYTNGQSKAAKETAVSTGQLVKAGVALGALKTAATAVVGAVKGIASAAKNAAKAVWNLGVESGQWADELITQSNQTGVDTTTLQEWGYAARFIDTEVSTMTKGMTKLTKAYAKGTSSKKKSVKVAKGVTVSLKKENGELKTQTEFYYDVIDSLHGMTNIAQRNAAAQQIFGKSYTDMLPLIESGTSALRAYGQEAHEMGVIISSDNVTALGKFDDTMQKFDATTQAIKTNLAVAFLPILELVSGKLTEFSGKVSGILSDGFQKEDVGKIIDAFFEMFDLDNGDPNTEGESVGQFIADVIDLAKKKIEEHKEEIQGIADSVMKFFVTGLKHAFGLKTKEEKQAAVLESLGLDEEALVAQGKDIPTEVVKKIAEQNPFAEVPTFKEAFQDSIIGRIIAAIKGSKDDPEVQSEETAMGSDLPTFFAQGVEENQQPIGDAADKSVDTVEEHAGGPSAHSRSSHWGHELASSYADGIRSGIPEVSAAAQDMADAASAPIHYSLPDYGPLRHVGEWGGEMIDQYVAGIKRNLYKVDAVMGGAVNSATMGGRTTNYGGVSINVYGAAGQDVNALADVIMVKMQNAVDRREAVFA